MGNVAMLSGRIATERELKTLHPKFARRCSVLYENLAAIHEAGRLKYRFEICEGFRHFSRQTALVAEGVSKEEAWASAHNFGLAADFVPYLTPEEGKMLGRPSGWYWPKITDEAWKILHEQAPIAGVAHPLRWDGPHIEFLQFEEMRKKYLV